MNMNMQKKLPTFGTVPGNRPTQEMFFNNRSCELVGGGWCAIVLVPVRTCTCMNCTYTGTVVF